MRSSVIARTRLIDDWLSEAAGADIDQLIILGAGYDSRAWRPGATHEILYRCGIECIGYPTKSWSM
jgi:O-methyltransferase involved in polyketide biosynthesis